MADSCCSGAGGCLFLKRSVLLWVGVALLLLLSPGLASAQPPVERIEATAVSAAEFPQIEVRFRALDNRGRHVSNLERRDIAITDNGLAATPEDIRDVPGPITLHFVIEAGVTLDDDHWAAARAAVESFAHGPWTQSGETRVAVSIVNDAGLETLIPFTAAATNLIDALPENNPSAGGFSEAPAALSALLDDMNREAAGEAAAIFFLTQQLEANTRAREVIEKSQAYDIPVYTALMRSSERPPETTSGGTPEPVLDSLVRQLAEETSGVFTLMNTDPERLIAAFDDLNTRRQQYVVVYRTGDSMSGTRNVEIAVLGVGTALDVVSYEIDVQPPLVYIDTPPRNHTITRVLTGDSVDPALAEPTTQRVVANIGFGENPRRRVRSAMLKVDNVQEGSALENPSLPERSEDPFVIDFLWDLRDVAAGDHTLTVEITDELGKSSSASTNVTVNVPRLPVPASTGVSPVNPTAPAPPAPTPIPCVLPEPLCRQVEQPVRRNPVAAISAAVALLALAFAGIVWANRDKAPIQRMSETVRRGIDRVTNRYRRAEVRAYLELLAGDHSVDSRYEIYGDTPIGRSRQNAQLLFQQEMENSPISRLHCTITDEEDHFMLRDEDSANGTYLNNERLAPLVPQRLKDGDIIELARVERGGVRLRFVAATPEDTLPPDSSSIPIEDQGRVTRQLDQTGGRF